MKPQPLSIHASLKDLFFLFFTRAKGIGALVTISVGGLICWFFVGASDWQAPLYKIMDVSITEGFVNSADRTNYLIDEESVIHYFFSFVVDEVSYSGDAYSHKLFPANGDTVEVVYLNSNPSISKIRGMTNAPWSSWLLMTLILPLIGIRLLIGGFKDVWKSVSLLSNGWVTAAEKGPMRSTGTTVNDRRVMEVTYHFRINESNHKCETQSSFPEDLQDEELVIFTGDSPENMIFVKDLTKGIRNKILAKIGWNDK